MGEKQKDSLGIDMHAIAARDKSAHAETERLHEAQRRARNKLHTGTINGDTPQQEDIDTIEGKSIEHRKTRHIPTAPVKK